MRPRLQRGSVPPVTDTQTYQGAAELVVHVIGHRRGRLDRRHPRPSRLSNVQRGWPVAQDLTRAFEHRNDRLVARNQSHGHPAAPTRLTERQTPVAVQLVGKLAIVSATRSRPARRISPSARCSLITLWVISRSATAGLGRLGVSPTPHGVRALSWVRFVPPVLLPSGCGSLPGRPSHGVGDRGGRGGAARRGVYQVRQVPPAHQR